jgi:alanine racemase
MDNKTVAEIKLDNLVHNTHAIERQVAPAGVIPVVKANAYGHGAVPVVKHLAKEGFKSFAVAQFQEAQELRESGITQPILIFGRLLPYEIPTAIKSGFRISIFGKEDLQWIENAGLNQTAVVHLNVETGMGRVGVQLDQEPDIFDRLIRSHKCLWEGIYSHFSTSDEADKEYANLQLSRFQKILTQIQQLKKKPSIIHMANSGAVLDIPKSYFDAVRPGILLYGHYPSAETKRSLKIRQVMTFKTYVSHIRALPEGFPISYGRRWVTPRATKIAVLPLGYADGLNRKLTNQGEVLIQGKRYPMVGTITMDQTMVDVANDSIKTGDEVILWGESDQGTMEASEVAEKIGTIPYEVTCGVSRRVPRVYVGKS